MHIKVIIKGNKSKSQVGPAGCRSPTRFILLNKCRMSHERDLRTRKASFSISLICGCLAFPNTKESYFNDGSDSGIKGLILEIYIYSSLIRSKAFVVLLSFLDQYQDKVRLL